jgi:hypothetical protein
MTYFETLVFHTNLFRFYGKVKKTHLQTYTSSCRPRQDNEHAEICQLKSVGGRGVRVFVFMSAVSDSSSALCGHGWNFLSFAATMEVNQIELLEDVYTETSRKFHAYLFHCSGLVRCEKFLIQQILRTKPNRSYSFTVFWHLVSGEMLHGSSVFYIT